MNWGYLGRLIFSMATAAVVSLGSSDVSIIPGVLSQLQVQDYTQSDRIDFSKPVNAITFREIEGINLPETKVNTFFDRAMEEFPRVRNREKFDAQVLRALEHYDFPLEDLCHLSVSDAIYMTNDITAYLLDYEKVDSQAEFILQYGRFLPLERYLEIGLGDCDKFADAFTAVFNFLKELNPGLINVYVGRGDSLAGIRLEHAYNCIIFETPDQVNFFHVDPTFSETQGKFIAVRGNQIPYSKLELEARFLMGFGQYTEAKPVLAQLARDMNWRDAESALEAMKIVSEQTGDRNWYVDIFSKEYQQ